jgi:preprotein translocase subunit YajC
MGMIFSQKYEVHMFDLLISSAHAQAATPAQPNAMASLIPFALIFVVFYFFMIKPQKKKMEQEKSFLDALKKGDEVYTKAGIIGTVSGLTDKVVTLEIAEGVKIKVIKSQVGGAASALLTPTVVEAKK